MNESIVICLLDSLQFAEREMDTYQSRLQETSDEIEIYRNCFLIEQCWIRKRELQDCLDRHLEEINITETINSFNPNIHTK